MIFFLSCKMSTFLEKLLQGKHILYVVLAVVAAVVVVAVVVAVAKPF